MPDGDIERRWWRESVVYQVYPRSFNDTDGDGVGDIPGIVEKVDYLNDLGVDVVWLNPVYDSPNADNGYDIADYRSIMDEFGTMADWEELLDELHSRDIKLIMDLVVNHTSDEHEWFVDSRAGDPEYEDFYIWRDGRDADEVSWSATEGPAGEAPPNAWKSYFGGPAWAYDEEREAWYLHLFDVKQPDLNWENPRVRDEVFEMMEWWFDKGIDGFRMDVINLISKPEGLPNDPDDPFCGAMTGPTNGPRVHEFLAEMNERVLDREYLTVGEMLGPEIPMEHARRYLDPDEDGLSMLFHFEHMLLDRGDNIWERDEWALSDLKAVFNRWDDGLKTEGWNSLYLNNHDQPRMVSRFGNDGEYRRESAKLLGTLLHTLRGTPYIYQGEELGMTNYPFESLDDFRDVDTLRPLENAIEAGEVDSFDAVKEAVRANSRDNARTPMQWSAGPNAGFTDGEPWLGVNPNKGEVNVGTERADEDSVWHYYRDLISLRKEYDVVVYGEYDPLFPDDDTVWAYTRTLSTADGDERLLVALNFSDDDVAVGLPDDVTSDEGALLIGNYPADGDSDVVSELAAGDLRLRPWEARVYDLR
ncbi:glycoside hydrolase family 13 protein [Salinigranum halophilum]|uniref:glycoside hydrolase family 13 protein n=1 Tax=Salinigranum halophilum TaxID=2565931 RepID=UPI0010A7ADB0|nr:alpha-glucosidase [Salinigranum halophilum]